MVTERRNRPALLKTLLVLFGVLSLAALFAIFPAGGGTGAAATTITINITAEVALVDDQHNILGGAINVGDIITGTYSYDSTTSDSNPLPTVGDYRHSSPPFGITVNAGGFVFQTDPSNVDFLVEIVNDHGTPASDNYLLRSFNNLPLSNGALVDHISWQLDDPTLTALSSEALPTVPPTLADWQSIFGLSITGGIPGDPFGFEYFIRAHVTDAQPNLALTSGFGTPTIDGVQGAGEWDTATQIPVFGGKLPGSTLFIMNDATNLYFGLSVTDITLSNSDAFVIRFDNDHNGTIDVGDDELRFTVDPLVGFRDTHFNGTTYGILDTQQDGSGSAGHVGAQGGAGTTNFFEVSHPLNSGDPDDISIAAGDTIGFCVRYFLDGVSFSPGTDFPSLCVLTVNQQLLYADLITPRETRTTTHNFVIGEAHDVPFQLFNVLTPGTIRATIAWEGETVELTATLTGRRRPALPDPTAAYAQETGTSPLTLTYTVTPEDVARGVGWRLALTDPLGNNDAVGTIELTVPFDEALDQQFQGEKVSLRSGDLWPSAALQTAFLDDLAAAPGDGLHALISFTQACTCYDNRLLERAGIFRQSFLPGRNSFGFVRKGVNLADPNIAGLVRAITPLEPEDKIDPDILVGNYAHFIVTPEGEPTQNYVLNDDGTLELSVLFARDAAQAEVLAILGAEAASFDAITDQLWQVTMEPANLASLAAHGLVEWIEAGPVPFLPTNSNTRPVVNVDAVQNPQRDTADLDGDGNVTELLLQDTGDVDGDGNTLEFLPNGAGAPNYQGLTGAGVTVGVDDSGVDATHNDLNVVADDPAAGSHGTHVAGIIAASGVQSNTVDADGDGFLDAPFQWRGMAPQAGLIDSSDLITAANLLAAIQNSSLDLTNHSHTLGQDGNYNTQNQTVDQEIRGGTTSGGTAVPRRPQVYAAGNNGTLNQYGSQIDYFAQLNQLKNAIVVGNWDATAAPQDLSNRSSLGPAHDGRIKPDVVAPGSNITSTGTGTTANAYRTTSGTSMASPVVAGILALLLEGWQNTYSTPLGTTIDANPPLPSTLKALIIQTATDQVNANVRNQTSAEVDLDSNQANGNDGLGVATATVGPDYATGWGLINAQAAVNLMQDFRMEDGVPVPNRIIQDTATQGEINEYDFVVDQVGPLQVTLAWDDVEASPANPATNPMLVNDLDLELVAPDGTIFYPWQLGHTILDAAGNPLANNAQPPGTTIQVQVPIAPTGTPATSNDYVPACALNGVPDGVCPAGTDDAWVATTGKDHLNNVEQVFVNVPNDLIGHWKVRVIGFNVQTDIQDYSLVGFPYPDLPELVAFSDDKVGITGLDTDITFTWSHSNIGPVGTGGTFEYQVLLSDDFFLGDDVVLADSATDAALDPLGALAAGASGDDVTSTIQISGADVVALLGAGSTFEDLLDADVFLLARVDSEDEILEHNETNITFVQLARLVDVVVVMDRSGSMSGSVPVSSGSQTKLQILQDSANLFLDLLRKDADDRLGQVSFHTNAAIIFDDGAGQVVELTADNLGDAQNAVDALVAGGSTNIRDALQDGLGMIPADAERRKVIVFLSDGVKTAGGDPTEAAFLQQFDDEGIKVFSVGFGTEGGSGYAGLDIPLLETLANVGERGFFHVTQSATGLDKFFVNAVAGAVEAEIIVDPIADIGPDATHTVDVPVGDQDSIVTFALTWDNPAMELNLALRGPSGTRITESNFGSFGDRVSLTTAPAYKLMAVHFPIAGGPNVEQGGIWHMEIHNPGADAARYSASVIAETTVRADVPQPQPPDGESFKPGDPMDLETSVRQLGGLPISDAIITVIPNVPLVHLGNLLSSGVVTAADLADVPIEINGEELTLQERMIMALQESLGRDPLPTAEGPPFELTETGTPGTYSGSFTDTDVPGPYTFTMRAEGLAERCQPVQRETINAVSVGAEVDPVRSVVVVVSLGDDRYTVVVTPFDAQDNYIGPGHAADISIDSDLLAPAGSVVDGLDGSYTQDFTAIAAGLATVQVHVLGVALPAVEVDTGAPVVGGVDPGGSTSGSSAVVVVVARGDVTAITGVRFVSVIDGSTTAFGSVASLDPRAGTVEVQVPAVIPAGRYTVHFETATGSSAATEEGSFRVKGALGDFPVYVKDLMQGAQAVLQAADRSELDDALSGLLRDLRRAPTGETLTPGAKQAAILEVVRLLVGDMGQVSDLELSTTLSAVNRAQIDSRFIPVGPTITPVGQNVTVPLGNDVSLTFGSVVSGGTSMVTLTEGPSGVEESRRGSPYLSYDISSTADSSGDINVSISYNEDDYVDESSLHLFHFQDGQWVDATTSLNTQDNVINGTVIGLSPFLILQGDGPVSAPSPAIQISLDIQPGSEGSGLDRHRQGVVPVAVRGSERVPAESIDVDSLRLGVFGREAEPLRSALEDVDGDGLTDLVLHFSPRDLGILPTIEGGNSIILTLTGRLEDGTEIRGQDEVFLTPGRKR